MISLRATGAVAELRMFTAAFVFLYLFTTPSYGKFLSSPTEVADGYDFVIVGGAFHYCSDHDSLMNIMHSGYRRQRSCQ